MKFFEVQMMDRANADEYYNGGNNYSFETRIYPAVTAEEAKAIAKTFHPDMIINSYVREVTEEVLNTRQKNEKREEEIFLLKRKIEQTEADLNALRFKLNKLENKKD